MVVIACSDGCVLCITNREIHLLCKGTKTHTKRCFRFLNLSDPSHHLVTPQPVFCGIGSQLMMPRSMLG